ncbi:hypothetical protein SAMN05518865_101539 [Duganella sp. CF458]|uniref:hypothetical protein n=1 Tax=Duganella sp. CF458 TaxID=1884368 RepID=UPI0008F25235|nr:hypothetical protein [Duganella sp. CF458]SFF56237.1 hypothetical protein SAMN05518865_101539 [Duganella sp. CF458]
MSRLLRAWDRRQLPLLLLLGAAWLLAHRWVGLWHDSRLYGVQALRRLLPDNFRNDLYFLYGSQDAYTVFSPWFAACIALLGIEGAGLLLYMLGSVLWLAAAGWLLANFLRGLAFWFGMLCLVLLPSDYGPLAGILTLGEPFPTPRIFAEALSMLALASLLRGKWAWSLPALGLALLLHPLMAAGAALVALLYGASCVAGRGRILLLGGLLGGAACVAAGVASGISPFNRILLEMDGEWLALVTRLAPLVSWDAWHADQWLSRTAVAFALVLTAARLAAARPARFFASLAAAGAIGLLASWLGTGWAHNLLLMQAQPWRVLWLLQLAAALALAWLLASYWQRGGVVRVLLLALVVATLTRNSFGGVLAIVAGAGLCWQLGSAAPLALSASTCRALTALVLAIGAAWLAEVVKHATDAGALAPHLIEDTAARIWGWTLLRTGALWLAGVGLLGLLWHWMAAGRHGRYLLACLAAVASLAGAACWRIGPPDYAYPISQQAQRDVQAAFLPLLPRNAVLYWENDVRATWFLLQRSSYVSSTQLAGLAFNRGTALEGARRLERLQRLGVKDAVRELDPAAAKRRMAQLPAPSAAGLAYVCGDPLLDFVVLTWRLGDGGIARVDDRTYPYSYYLYDCARLRGGP